MNHEFSNLKKRTLSAALLAPPVLWCIYAGGAWFSVLMVLGAWCLTGEWHSLTREVLAGSTRKQTDNTPQDLWYLRFVVGMTLILAALGLYGLAIVPLVAGAVLMVLYGCSAQHHNLAPLTGLIYITLPILAIMLIREVPVHGRVWMFWLMIVVWATDIGGYFIGKHFGGAKLAPSISPGKTWSGLAGAVSWAAMAGGAFAFALDGYALRLALLAAILAVVAQLGDLFESKVKRMFGKKDSGALIPGHGGLFDRVDGLLSAAVLLCAVLYGMEWIRCGLGGVGCL